MEGADQSKSTSRCENRAKHKKGVKIGPSTRKLPEEKHTKMERMERRPKLPLAGNTQVASNTDAGFTLNCEWPGFGGKTGEGMMQGVLAG